MPINWTEVSRKYVPPPSVRQLLKELNKNAMAKKLPAVSTKEKRAEELKEQMKTMRVMIPEWGWSDMFDLCENVGIKNRVAYWNEEEKALPKSKRSIKNITEVREVIHEYGLIFNNGLELRNIDQKIWSLYSAEVIRRRERDSGYKLSIDKKLF